MARAYTDREIVAKYAVVLQARRNKMRLGEGEDDTMRTLSFDEVLEIVKELQDKFHSRPDQVRKRAVDDEQWNNLLTKKTAACRAPSSAPKAGSLR